MCMYVYTWLIFWRKEEGRPVGPWPRLFMSLDMMRNMTGVQRPSPTAPKNPIAINNKSMPSACLKMVLMEEAFLLAFLVGLPTGPLLASSTISSSLVLLLIFFLLPVAVLLHNHLMEGMEAKTWAR